MAVKDTFTIQINNSMTEKTKSINIANPKADITTETTRDFRTAYIALYGLAPSATTIVQSYYSKPTFVDEPAV